MANEGKGFVLAVRRSPKPVISFLLLACEDECPVAKSEAHRRYMIVLLRIVWHTRRTMRFGNRFRKYAFGLRRIRAAGEADPRR